MKAQAHIERLKSRAHAASPEVASLFQAITPYGSDKRYVEALDSAVFLLEHGMPTKRVLRFLRHHSCKADAKLLLEMYQAEQGAAALGMRFSLCGCLSGGCPHA